MNTIKFSHKYEKMPVGYEISELLAVFLMDREDISEGFRIYDTLYYEDVGQSRFYELPKGKVMVLLLRCNGFHLWTTIRRWTPQKEKYYRGLVGQEVKIEIKN